MRKLNSDLAAATGPYGTVADLLRTVWRTLASLAKPKEWSVKFTAGVADLEIKFGA
jgi:hypothetical protein